MTEPKKDKEEKEPTPKDAQKGGQGAVSPDHPEIELNQEGHPGSDKK